MKQQTIHLYFQNETDRVAAVNLLGDDVHWILNPDNCLTLTATQTNIRKTTARLDAYDLAFEKLNHLKKDEHFPHDVCPKCATPSRPGENVPDQTLRYCPKCLHEWFENLDAPPLTATDYGQEEI